MTTIEAIAKNDFKQYIFASDDTFKGNDDFLVKKIKHTWKKAKLTSNSVLVWNRICYIGLAQLDIGRNEAATKTKNLKTFFSWIMSSGLMKMDKENHSAEFYLTESLTWKTKKYSV